MHPPELTTLRAAADWLEVWLTEQALPVWSSAGVDARNGSFHDALTLEGAPVPAPRRARVQARQAFVYATAALEGLGDDWRKVADAGFAFYLARFRRADGLFARATDADGTVIDPTPALYEQDFSLLAMAALHRAAPDAGWRERAMQTFDGLAALRHPQGGFKEFGAHPFQANAHMHLLEAALAWEAADGGAAWAGLADQVAGLALSRFVDRDGGFLREFFDADWAVAAGDEGRWVEPGHQFEWAWLLETWGLRRGEAAARRAASRLFEVGKAGVDRKRGVAVDVLWDDLTPRAEGARLWPQAEWLKAALVLGDEAEALRAAQGLAGYLDAPAAGVWRDKLKADGGFVVEPAPASSLYHIATAVLELRRWRGRRDGARRPAR